MSGRSAHVRAKHGEIATRKQQQQYPEYGPDAHFVYGFQEDAPLSRPSVSIDQSYLSNPSYASMPPHRRRQSISSGGSTYAYPLAPVPRKPRPIIIASAIEKSDFRTHLDGMSKSVRGKIGRFMKGGDDGVPPSPQPRQQRPGTVSVSSDSASRSTGFTPSLGAVPSLAPSTPPTDLPTFPHLGSPSPHAMRAKQQESVIHKIRRFEGGGKVPQLGWKSLANNPELWDENGDTFVYMYMRGSRTKPPPSFRIHSRVIYDSGSEALTNQLSDSSVPEGWPRFCPSDLPSPDGSNSPDYPLSSFIDSARNSTQPSIRTESDDMDSLRPLDLSVRNFAKAPKEIQHEIYIAWPGSESGIHSTIWHITTRNFFAVMYDAKALVGTTLYEAIAKLFDRVSKYPDYLDKSVGKAAWITDYLLRHNFDDVRNNPSYAASLLAFSELSGVQWREGYVEAFIHCAGMLNMGLQAVPEWRLVTPHTKMFLHNANLELEERIHRAQKWLVSFDFSEMMSVHNGSSPAVRGCCERLRKWFCKYYENAFVSWPPRNEETWLTHDVVVRLRNDFNGLYDYLVDRDVMFDGSEYRSGQKWTIVSKSGQVFHPDTSELALTDSLLEFDSRNNFPHIPHPYPLTPTSFPVQSKNKGAFTLKKPASQSETLAQSRRKALSYAEASNVYTLRDQYMHTDLLTNFVRFEQADMVDSLDPFEARRARWLMIYGVLQVLATVAVDSPIVRYKEKVQYHISPRMKGVVPWAEPGSTPEEEAEHKKSHCWVVPNTWSSAIPKARAGAHKPIMWGQYGDGRTRAEAADNALGQIEKTSTQTREASVGRKRAEEWVAANGGPHTDTGSDSGINGGGSQGRSNSGTSGGDAPSGSSGESAADSAAAAARRRRALIHGFTDFKVPSEW